MPTIDTAQPDAIDLPSQADLICFSHLRWNFVFQRPQHLMTRCARDRRVYFLEEPIFSPIPAPQMVVDRSGPVVVLVPHLPLGGEGEGTVVAQRELLDAFMAAEGIGGFIAWYYTPMALSFSDHLCPLAAVYDCMDELSAFRGAPAELRSHEGTLMARANLVLTGGQTLYEEKRAMHRNIHPFPSSVDVNHFGRARQNPVDPLDQAGIPHPRLGFCGVIDERMDLDLLAGLSMARPDWQIILVGPIVKIDPGVLPRHPNIHYLGPKQYEVLPEYIGGWDVALLPFARNEATHFISPTKTPEYMAAGKPVVSTSIRDVVRPYGQQGLVRIADDVGDFVRACHEAMAEDPVARVMQADAFLRHTSWDGTWRRISLLLDAAAREAATANNAMVAV